MDLGRRRTDPRSPVQPGRSDIPYFLAGVVAAFAIWIVQQNWRQDFEPERPSASAPNKSARGDLRTLFSADDYPIEAARRDEQGTVQAELTIDKKGRVSRCRVMRSSGSELLDTATCRILQRRARFVPARDSAGKAVPDTVVTPPIIWRLEG